MGSASISAGTQERVEQQESNSCRRAEYGCPDYWIRMYADDGKHIGSRAREKSIQEQYQGS